MNEERSQRKTKQNADVAKMSRQIKGDRKQRNRFTWETQNTWSFVGVCDRFVHVLDCPCPMCSHSAMHKWQQNVQRFEILLHSIRCFLFVCSVMSKIVRAEWFCYWLLLSLAFVVDVTGRKNGKHSRKYSMLSNSPNGNDLDNDLSLWIDESQVKRFSGK